MMYNNQKANGLFASGDVRQYISDQVYSAVNQAKALSADTFEANSDEQIIDHICSKYPVLQLGIRPDEKDVNLVEDKLDARYVPNRLIFDDTSPLMIDSIKVTWQIPITGTIDLFHLRPSTSIMSTIKGLVTPGGTLVLSTNLPADTSSESDIQSDLNNQLATIEKMIQYVNNDIAGYDSSLRSQVESAVVARKQALDKILKLKTALKVPIHNKQNAGPLHKIEVAVKRLSPLSSTKEVTSAYIEDTAYESILSVIRSMGASMETSRASESKDEEALRDIMLVGLNASIDHGSAGAETFRKKGKTDIAVLFDNKAAFVAECKLWRGEQYASEGLDQLLGYLTWRDAKTSLVFFNKHNKNFSDIQTKIDSIFTSHPNFIKTISTKEGEWRYVFKKPDDDNRLITVHVFLFDVHDGKEAN